MIYFSIKIGLQLHIMKFSIHLAWQLAQPISQPIDPRLFTLLSAINEKGALTKAAKDMAVSYRFAWGLLSKWEQICGQPLVILEQGRGARLAPAGQLLLEAYQDIQTQLSSHLNQFSNQFSQRFSHLIQTSASSTTTLFASHELALIHLRDYVLNQYHIHLDLHFHGSLESLQQLQQGRCHIAGFHIPEGPLSQNIAPYFQELIDNDSYRLILVAKRNQGLMVQRGNPAQIHSLHSLAERDLRFINRQAGSGTRLLFDALLQAHHIPPAHINGYQHEEFTHLAVAAMIASHEADAGFGIASAAKKFNLDFLPVLWERYCLAIPVRDLSAPPIQAIIASLQDKTFIHPMADWPGYDFSQCGAEIAFEDLIS